ncbi:VQ motif [Arabidopsis suecica]|uniref:VQ motif n=1 Tax=Arabidopsis suecica TaxID=45249 RepID=A0A8T2ANK5_ARASU|nr:VQ motif [Arabidopsis suecica]
MENSSRYRDDAKNLLPSPSSCTTTPTRLYRSTNMVDTTFIRTDPASFKQVVQLLTGIPKTPPHQPDPRFSSFHSIPPIKSVPNKKQSSSFRLYERRNSMKHYLKINPTHSVLPETLSPSVLDFPALALSPDTPLMPDLFSRSGSLSQTQSPSDPKPSSDDEEERAIKEKGFYLHPSPSTTPRDTEPRLLSLFPVTSTLSPPSPHDQP